SPGCALPSRTGGSEVRCSSPRSFSSSVHRSCCRSTRCTTGNSKRGDSCETKYFSSGSDRLVPDRVQLRYAAPDIASRSSPMTSVAEKPDIKSYQQFIDGKWVDAASGEKFERVSPYDGSVVATYPNSGIEDAQRAIEVARRV